ncbi:MAG: hypothetical protein ACO1TE_22365 [Prosthecobacter sp.]
MKLFSQRFRSLRWMLGASLLPPWVCTAADAPAPAKPAVAAAAPAPTPAPAAKPKTEATAFIRYLRGEDGDALQTAIVSYESPQKVRVELVGAVHIADKPYFDALNRRFKRYDAVLYELVGPPIHEMDKDPAAKEKHQRDRQRLAWVGMLQAKMKEMLGLQGQLESIDYRAKNFVHADMDTAQFTDTQEEKQESFLSLYFKAAMAQKEVNAEKGVDSDTAGMVMMLKLLTAKDSSTGLKRMLAEQFETVGDIMAGVEAGNGTVIVGERNRVALEVMDKEIAAGKKNLAIFYGAAHLGDMENRLKARGYKRVKTEWVTAWDLPHDG